MKCFGRNYDGQLGYGDTNDRGGQSDQMGDNLKDIDLGSNFVAVHIEAGGWHSCALSQQGTAKCWGWNAYGQLGIGDANNRGVGPNQMGDDLLEIDLGPSFNAVQISAGLWHTCAISEGDKIKCWGRNRFGQLGYGDTNNRGDGANEMGNYLSSIEINAECFLTLSMNIYIHIIYFILAHIMYIFNIK